MLVGELLLRGGSLLVGGTVSQSVRARVTMGSVSPQSRSPLGSVASYNLRFSGSISAVSYTHLTLPTT